MTRRCRQSGEVGGSGHKMFHSRQLIVQHDFMVTGVNRI